MKQAKLIKTMSYAAMCLALALILPFLTAQIPEIGQALSPMHIPAFLCGFICGGRRIFFLFFPLDNLVDEFVHCPLHLHPKLRLGAGITLQLDAMGAPRERAAQIAPRALTGEPLFDVENMLLPFKFFL